MSPSEEHIAFYYELGFAITQWAHIEHHLCLIATACFERKDAKLVGLGFFSIENFRSKLQFIHRIFRQKFEGTNHINDWLILHDRINTWSAKRNHLAHYTAHGYMMNRPGRRYALIPWISTGKQSRLTRRNPNLAIVPPEALFVRDIIAIRFEFFAITVSLRNFLCRLNGEPEIFPKSSEQPSCPPTIHTIRDQIHVALGHRLGPSRKKP